MSTLPFSPGEPLPSLPQQAVLAHWEICLNMKQYKNHMLCLGMQDQVNYKNPNQLHCQYQLRLLLFYLHKKPLADQARYCRPVTPLQSAMQNPDGLDGRSWIPSCSHRIPTTSWSILR